MFDAMRILNKWQPMMDADDKGGAGGTGADDKNLDKGEKDPDDKGEKKPKEKEGATGEEDKGEKKYSNADLDRIIEKKWAKWQETKQKEIDEAKKLADMTAQEKAEFKLKQTEEKLQELERRETIRSMMNQARDILADKKINVPDAVLANLVTEDAESTKKAVDAFAKVFTDAVDAAVKDALKQPLPKGGNGGGTATTKAEILAIKDPAERRKAIQNNIGLFER